MNDKKYAIHPGYVYSKSDGDEHYVGFRDLVRLYRVKSSECFEWDNAHAMGRKYDDYIHLVPQSDGDYRLPTEKPQMSERELLRKAAKTDPVARGAYADYLEEHGETVLALVCRMSAESLWELKQVLAEAVDPASVGSVKASYMTASPAVAAMVTYSDSYTAVYREYLRRMQEFQEQQLALPSRLITEPSGMNYVFAIHDGNGIPHDVLFGSPNATRLQGPVPESWE